MQNFGVTNKKHYGMLWYFLEWSIILEESVLINPSKTSDDLANKLRHKSYTLSILIARAI